MSTGEVYWKFTLVNWKLGIITNGGYKIKNHADVPLKPSRCSSLLEVMKMGHTAAQRAHFHVVTQLASGWTCCRRSPWQAHISTLNEPHRPGRRRMRSLNPRTFCGDDGPAVLIRISRREAEQLHRQEQRGCPQMSAGRHARWCGRLPAGITVKMCGWVFYAQPQKMSANQWNNTTTSALSGKQSCFFFFFLFVHMWSGLKII